MGYDAQRLTLLFKRSSSLPPLPQATTDLISLIDSGEAGAADLERIIRSDPKLAATVVRVASSPLMGYSSSGDGIQTVRAAIMRLGQNNVRMLATSLAFKSSITQESGQFDGHRFARHSLTVAVLARYLFARRMRRGEMVTRWSPEEVFSVGLLHDLGLARMSSAAPSEFDRVFAYSRRNEISLDAGVKALFDTTVGELGAFAAETWNLAQVFKTALRYLNKPWEHEPEFSALCCLCHAHYIADGKGISTTSWTSKVEPIPEVEAEVDIADAEVEALLPMVTEQVESFIAPLLAKAA